MTKEAEPGPPAATTLRSALLDYFEAPGKYQLTLRQPAFLFSSIREILQLASGRGPAEQGGADGDHLRQAANFFIRAALLFPGADHYAVLGLPSGEAPGDLKERYRLLMRLIHPDFAQPGAAAWPADAAVKVNRAYEVLSSAVLRREYDDQLANPRAQRPVVPPKGPARRLEEHTPRFGKKAALAFGLAVGIPAVLLLMPRSEPDQLVQRTGPAPAARADLSAAASAELASRHRLHVTLDSLPPQDREPEVVAAAPIPFVAETPSSPPARRDPPIAAPAAMTKPVPPAPAAPFPPVAARAATPAPLPAAPAARLAAPPELVAARTVEPRRPPQAPAATEPEPAPPVVAAAPLAQPAAVVVADLPPLASAAPSALPAGKLTTTLALPPVAPPTMEEAQPLLSQMLQLLESGKSDQILRLLDGEARRQPGAQALSRQYEQLVRGGRPVHLSQVEFNSEPREGGVLLVTGRIQLHSGEPTIGSYGQRLLLKAEFAQRGGKVQLTGLSGAPD